MSRILINTAQQMIRIFIESTQGYRRILFLNLILKY